MQCNVNTHRGLSYNTNTTVIANNYIKVNYFLPGPGQETYMKASANIPQQLQKECKDVFMGIGCFDGIFSLKVEETANHTRQYQDMWYKHYESYSGKT